MPFELTFEEPSRLADRVVLLSERRETLRRAVGEKLVQRAGSLVETAVSDERDLTPELIPLDASGLIEDFKHDWIAVPILELFDLIAEVGSIDLLDDAAVGAQLRPGVQRLIYQAGAVSELLRFFDLFEPTSVDLLVRPAAICGLRLVEHLVGWMTSVTDEGSGRRGESFDLAADDLRDQRAILCALPFSEELVPIERPTEPDGLGEFERHFGVAYPSDAERWIDVLRHFEDAGLDLCELGSRQLRYFGPYRATDPIWSRNFFQLGLRIARSAYPLLAHRSAYLAWRLLQRAVAIDEQAAHLRLHGLFNAESPWMIASQEDYEGAISRYLDGDSAAIVEAYSDLAEGTLRRYGSLVVALERIAAGKTATHPLVFENVGDLEAQLAPLRTQPLPRLILRFLERGLRNAEAHANVIVGLQGTLQVKLKDGTVETVHPNQVYGRTAGLRSIMDGVDIAMNHASIVDNEKHVDDLLGKPMHQMSAPMFERVVQQAAQEHTRGVVASVERRESVLTVTYHGEPVYEELLAFANSILRLLGQPPPAIHVVASDGAAIATFRPPRERPPVGRNDPCPCGSGKKYKRCHGS